MQILLRVVPSFANYQVWWPYKTYISFSKKLYMNSYFATTFFFFFFCRNNLKILRLKLTHEVVVKHASDMKFLRLKLTHEVVVKHVTNMKNKNI